MIKRSLQINCLKTFAMLLITSLFVNSPVYAELPVPAAEVLFTQVKTAIKSGEIEEARQLSKKIIQTWPRSLHAMSAFQAMVSDLGGFQGVPDYVYTLTVSYAGVGQSDKASELRQTIRDTWPNSTRAMLLRAEDIQNLIASEDITTAEVEFLKLYGDFSGKAEFPKALNWVANAYEKSGYMAKSADLRRTIINTWPQSLESLKALTKIAIAAIKDRDESLALDTVETIRADYTTFDAKKEVVKLYLELGRIDEVESYLAGNTGLDESAKIIRYAARDYRVAGELEKVKVLSQLISTKYPDHEYGFDAKKDVVKAYLELGRIDEVKSYLAGNTGQDECARIIRDVAKDYRLSNQTDKGKALCQLIIAKYPQSQSALRATKDLAIIAVKSGDEQAARHHCKNIIANYLDYPDATKEFLLIGEAYYKKALLGDYGMAESDPNTQIDPVGNEIDPNSLSGPELYFTRTIEICKCILEDMPAFDREKLVAETYHMLAASYSNLGRHDLAITHLTTILETCPEYERRWYIQYSIGETYQQMKILGSMAAGEADNKTRIAYQQVIDEYPDCPLVRIVSKWLRLNS